MAGRDEHRRATFGRSRRGRFWLIFLPVPLLLCLLIGAAAWPWHIAPPPVPREQAVVYLADYGRHSRLAMQVDAQRMLEYSFGDWRYYAGGESTLWRGVVALIVPTQAALGRRHLRFIEDEERFNEMTGAVRSLRIEVERTKLDELLTVLNARYEAQLATEIETDWTDMTFVQDSRPYHLLRNSNHQTASWLRTLGCEVGHFPILSNFRAGKGRE